jgi:hypothetical protein
VRRGAVAAVAVVLAGCGGSGEQEARDRAVEERMRYGQAVNGFCRDVSASVDRVQQDLSGAQGRAGDDVEAAAKAVGTALQDFARSIGRAVDELRGAPVPAQYRGFHDRAVGGLGRVVGALEQAGTRAEQGDLQGLAQLGTTLDDIEVPDPPADLRRAAPACQDLSRRRAG